MPQYSRRLISSIVVDEIALAHVRNHSIGLLFTRHDVDVYCKATPALVFKSRRAHGESQFRNARSVEALRRCSIFQCSSPSPRPQRRLDDLEKMGSTPNGCHAVGRLKSLHVAADVRESS